MKEKEDGCVRKGERPGVENMREDDVPIIHAVLHQAHEHQGYEGGVEDVRVDEHGLTLVVVDHGSKVLDYEASDDAWPDHYGVERYEVLRVVARAIDAAERQEPLR